MPVVLNDDTLMIVDRPAMPPGHCIASLSDVDPKGFIDTGMTPALIDPRIYVSVSWIESIARKMGMDYVDSASDERVVELERELAEAEKYLQAVDVMESAGFVARKRPGRKPKDPVDK